MASWLILNVREGDLKAGALSLGDSEEILQSSASPDFNLDCFRICLTAEKVTKEHGLHQTLTQTL